MANRRSRVIDLFSGGGGLTLGARLAGFSSLAVEIDSHLSSNFETNFPHDSVINCDISDLDPRALLTSIGEKPRDIAGIIGGPPCQGFSVIGKRDPKDPRNKLVSQFFRFVRDLQPPFFFFENVPGILTPEFLPILQEELDNLSSYEVIGPLTIDAAAYGAATHRRRVVVIGYRSAYVTGISETDIRLARTAPATVAEALSDLPRPSLAIRDSSGESWGFLPPIRGENGVSAYARTARSAPGRNLASRKTRLVHAQGRVSGFQTTKHTEPVLARFRGVEPGRRDPISRFTRLRWDTPAPALRAGTGKELGSYQAARPLHPKANRVITVREAARLQGFPDWFSFHPTIWHSFRMIGNSVSPYPAMRILQLIRHRLA